MGWHKRCIHVIYIKFDNNLDDSGKFDRKDNLVKKPICVINYNQCMGSIDKTRYATKYSRMR